MLSLICVYIRCKVLGTVDIWHKVVIMETRNRVTMYMKVGLTHPFWWRWPTVFLLPSWETWMLDYTMLDLWFLWARGVWRRLFPSPHWKRGQVEHAYLWRSREEYLSSACLPFSIKLENIDRTTFCVGSRLWLLWCLWPSATPRLRLQPTPGERVHLQLPPSSWCGKELSKNLQ